MDKQTSGHIGKKKNKRTHSQTHKLAGWLDWLGLINASTVFSRAPLFMRINFNFNFNFTTEHERAE
jgi:hypothetical protein